MKNVYSPYIPLILSQCHDKAVMIHTRKPDYWRAKLVLRIFLSIIILVIMSFSFNAQADEVDDVTCLALNVYHEARNKSSVNQLTVAMVTMERVYDKRFEDNVCDVVHDGYVPGRKDCHFSWYCDGKPDTPYNHTAYKKSFAIAQVIYYNYDYMIHPMKGANHYHTDDVDPYWNEDMRYIGSLDNHLFWKWE